MRLIVSKDTARTRSQFRKTRNEWLAVSDAYMWPDRGLSEPEKETLLAFRQCLRDAPTDALPSDQWTLPNVPVFIKELT